MTPGLDPLGLQTITQDRILPDLVPGILVLSQRARYLSIYSYLLRYYEEQQLAPRIDALSDFIRTWEFEYAVAAVLCPNNCGASGVVGTRRARPAARSTEERPLERGFSVESTLGGYGLYYRTPLEELGVIAWKGTLLGDQPIPIDVLRRDGRGEELAERFSEALAETTYYRDFMGKPAPIPRDVLVEYSARCCLCRLSDFPAEQAALRGLVIDDHPTVDSDRLARRRASFAFFLESLGSTPDVAESDGALREAALDRYRRSADASDSLSAAALSWAAFALKEYMQEALSCVWIDFVETGFRLQPDEGLGRPEVDEFIRSLVPELSTAIGDEDLEVRPDADTALFVSACKRLPGRIGWETLREWAIDESSAISGLVLLAAVVGNTPALREAPRAWSEVAFQGTEAQPGLAGMVAAFRAHLTEDPSLGDTLVWLVSRYVIATHEAIAYSKLPEFTFRFRWEAGRLTFYNLGRWRFELSDARRAAISWISRDVGLWDEESGEPRPAHEGKALIAEVEAA